MYVSTVENPSRFSRSRAVGAHLGLTPRRYQSGETDRSGHISRCGDGLARTLLYEAATVILHRVKRPLHLKDWAEAIERRSGSGKARVALHASCRSSCTVSGDLASHSAGPSRPWQRNASTSSDTPIRIAPGRGCRQLRGGPVGACQRKPVVDLAMPVLRTGPDVAAARADREENHDPGGRRKQGS